MEYNFGLPLSERYRWEDKKFQCNSYIRYMLARTQRMFEYEGLPDTIPQRMLELYLQTNGNVCIAEHKGDVYAFTGGLGGVPNEYYMPTQYIVANPYLELSKSYTINKDCVVILNDSMYQGLAPMFARYASLLVENDITMRICDITTRIQKIISASDDKTKASATEYLKQVEKGNIGIVGENQFFEGIRTNDFNGSNGQNGLTSLIEYQQYLKASWFNDLGLQANYNMKRESINSNEAQLNEDALFPFIDDMLQCRQEGLDKVNKMFNLNITIKKSSSWEDNQIELDEAQKMSDPEEPQQEMKEEPKEEPQETEEKYDTKVSD